MKLKFVSPAVAAACLAFASTTSAVVYTETGADAGDLPATAQVAAGPANTALTRVDGTLTLTNGTSDSDMFEIYINNPSAFSASDTAFVPGYNNFDSQIFLFSATGLGIVGNDDAATGGPAVRHSGRQLQRSSGAVLSAQAGLYYLLISGSGRYATSGAGLIFPNYTDGTTDPTATVGPTGAGASPVSGYTGSSNEAGRYQISLAGAQFVVVPEPGSALFVLAGLASLGWVLPPRRRARLVS